MEPQFSNNIGGAAAPVAKPRIYWLDFGKVLAAFLVVFAHVIYSEDSFLCSVIWAFHLPFFFLISGIFHKDRQKIDWKTHAQRLLLPAFIFCFFDALYYVIYNGIVSGEGMHGFLSQAVVYAKYFVLRMLRGHELGPTWFLFALFWCRVLGDLFLLIKNRWISGGILLAGLLVPYLLGFRFPFFLSQGFMAMPFYLAGYFGSTWLKTRKPSWKYLAVTAVCLVATILLTRWNGKVSMNGFYFGSLPVGLNLVVFYLNGFIGSAMLLSIALLPLPEFKSVKMLASALITIVGVQSIFLGLTGLLFKGAERIIPYAILISIVILWLCYLVHLLIGPLYTPKKK